jgi:AmiR/NasT family two-component response regulator
VEYKNVDTALVRQAKVLVVEDDLLIAQDIMELLLKFGCGQVELAHSVCPLPQN